MSSSWKKVRSLFWQSGQEGNPPAPVEAAGADAGPDGGSVADSDLSDADFAALLQGSPHSVGKDVPAARVDASSVKLSTGGGAVSIEFQEQYYLAGIRDTDEVEQL